MPLADGAQCGREQKDDFGITRASSCMWLWCHSSPTRTSHVAVTIADFPYLPRPGRWRLILDLSLSTTWTFPLKLRVMTPPWPHALPCSVSSFAILFWGLSPRFSAYIWYFAPHPLIVRLSKGSAVVIIIIFKWCC